MRETNKKLDRIIELLEDIKRNTTPLSVVIVGSTGDAEWKRDQSAPAYNIQVEMDTEET